MTEPTPDATLGDLWLALTEARAEVERLTREVRALRQDDGAVIAKLQAEKEMYRKASDADGFHRVLAAREAEIGKLRTQIAILVCDRNEWKERWQAEHDDHKATMEAFDKAMDEGP